MCRNHSHLIARLVGEDTTGEVPTLMFALANQELIVEAPAPAGMKLTLPTSGMLYLPSWLLGGWALATEPPTEVQHTSLFLLPGDAMTIMHTLRHNLTHSLGFFGTISPDGAHLRRLRIGTPADEQYWADREALGSALPAP